MAAIEQLFRTHMLGVTAISAAVGTRIYPNVAPQTAVFPYITYQVISSVEHLVKPSVSTLRLKRKRIQLDAYAKGNGAYGTVKGIEDAIKAAAYSFNSSVNNAVVETRVLNAADGKDEDEGITRVSVDVSILFNE